MSTSIAPRYPVAMTLRKRDAQNTKARILRAAQELFSTRGYAGTGVRDITDRAGINISLVSRYFGSKEKLFEAALGASMDAVSILEDIQPETFGKQMVAAFLNTQADEINPLHIMVLAAGDDSARAIADRVHREKFIALLTQWFDKANLNRSNSEARAALFAALAAGFHLYRLLYPLEPLTGEMTTDSRRWLEQAFQSIVDVP